MRFSRPRGTQDIFSPEAYTWRGVERVFESVFERFGYDAIRTPIFEQTELFERTVGEETDIISKEMYTFTDRGGRSLTLRPESTAPVVRAYLEKGMHRLGGIVRLYYIGPMFRYDRPQAGRFREFHQVGVEAIGSSNPGLDVEVIEVVLTALEELAFEDLLLKINSVGCPACRELYRALLGEALGEVEAALCGDCRVRAKRNPLRVFDCKRCTEIKKRLPLLSSSLCEECKEHFEKVKAGLETLGRDFEVDPYLVRGLDYYTKTTFEVIHGDLGAQNALCGGGRYDNLIETCGGPPMPAVGFSAGLERIISILPGSSPARRAPGKRVDFYIVCEDGDSTQRALRAARTLRSLGKVWVDFSLRNIKRQLRSAEKAGARVAVLLGSARPGRLLWKEMGTREQFEVEDGNLPSFAGERVGDKGGGQG